MKPSKDFFKRGSDHFATVFKRISSLRRLRVTTAKVKLTVTLQLKKENLSRKGEGGEGKSSTGPSKDLCNG